MTYVVKSLCSPDEIRYSSRKEAELKLDELRGDGMLAAIRAIDDPSPPQPLLADDDDNLISIYTSNDGVADGTLFDILDARKEWERGIFRYVTIGVMSLGYLQEDGSANIPNLVDLLQQCLLAVKKQSHNFRHQIEYCETRIELPSGDNETVWMEINEKAKFTILLPSEH